MKKVKKIRIDEVMVLQKLCESRNQAQILIMSGKVRIGTETISKSSKLIDPDLHITIQENLKYVSRGGLKLEKFLDTFGIEVIDFTAMDVGASTGGFTDCLLQKGAKKVLALDVGYGQLHYKLRQDQRVESIEKINVRYLTAEQVSCSEFDIIVIDVSFISITKIIPSIWPFLKSNGILIGLIKPQFEATKNEVDKGQGIIKDVLIHERIIKEIETFFANNFPTAIKIGLIESPIMGTEGNIEFLIGFKKNL